MANYDFRSDLVLGNKGEDVVIEDLKKMGAKLISKNNDNRWDLIMEVNDKQISYEIKTDVYCKPDYDTGNLFVEFECRGKPSGIIVTKAKWFVTYFKYLNEIWYIETDTLKMLIDVNENKIRQTKHSGDKNSNTKGYLFPRWKFKDDFIIRKVKC
jgi:hypothetical protein